MAETIPEDEALARLRNLADSADHYLSWPEQSWQILRSSGALQWTIPTSYGGLGLHGVLVLEKYERLASACLTTSFILSQRDAACRRILDSGNRRLSDLLLPPLARGEAFATVGLSQLTTSRQHTQASFRARIDGSALILDGAIPWVTGAVAAHHFVIGAVLADGRQILGVLPSATPGIELGHPLELAALRGSMTAEVRCTGVVLGCEWILAGPAPQVMAGDRSGTGGLETSCLALGVVRAALNYLDQEASRRPDLVDIAAHLQQEYAAIRRQMHAYADNGFDIEAAFALRGRANSLVLRTTQAALTASKGTGFLRTHPAQRWARQALFFLVWSCPRAAVEATLAYLAPPCSVG
jgi:butyryl-CoA dehydrogenase